MKYILFCFIVLVMTSYDLPKGWFPSGSKPGDYAMGTDMAAGRNHVNAATIKSLKRRIKGFGTLMQNFSPEKYWGKHIRMTAYMKSENVDNWAGMWLRVDGPTRGITLSFDNMYQRSIKGSQDWTKCEIVLDVPAEATNIACGSLLHGPGQIWFCDLNFEVVGTDVPTTGMPKVQYTPPTEPQNVNFKD